MKTKFLTILTSLCCLFLVPAFAGWEYDGYYVNEGSYSEDGMKFVMSARIGGSYSKSKIENEMGNIYGYYYIDSTNGNVISETAWHIAGEPEGYVGAFYTELSKIPVKDDKFEKYAFAAGASLGFTIPYHQQWRLEASWDHISELDYNQIPMFEGDVILYGSDETASYNALVQSGGVSSSVSTDIISAMLYYDFFEGISKPISTLIPYIGFGFGYADSKTKLKVTDIYGDLSTDSDLYNNYGVLSDDVIQFYNSEKSDSNISILGALGFSYGITQSMYFDFGLRVAYIPKITWSLSNSDGTQYRDWFAAKNMIYTNASIGIRFEF